MIQSAGFGQLPDAFSRLHDISGFPALGQLPGFVSITAADEGPAGARPAVLAAAAGTGAKSSTSRNRAVHVGVDCTRSANIRPDSAGSTRPLTLNCRICQDHCFSRSASLTQRQTPTLDFSSTLATHHRRSAWLNRRRRRNPPRNSTADGRLSNCLASAAYRVVKAAVLGFGHDKGKHGHKGYANVD